SVAPAVVAAVRSVVVVVAAAAVASMASVAMSVSVVTAVIDSDAAAPPPGIPVRTPSAVPATAAVIAAIGARLRDDVRSGIRIRRRAIVAVTFALALVAAIPTPVVVAAFLVDPRKARDVIDHPITHARAMQPDEVLGVHVVGEPRLARVQEG